MCLRDCALSGSHTATQLFWGVVACSGIHICRALQVAEFPRQWGPWERQRGHPCPLVGLQSSRGCGKQASGHLDSDHFALLVALLLSMDGGGSLSKGVGVSAVEQRPKCLFRDV